MKRNNKYKEIYNRSLDEMKSLQVGDDLPTEKSLSDQLFASRTTIRSVLTHLTEEGLIVWEGRKKTILRMPLKKNYYINEETKSTEQRIESLFMDWVLGGDLDAGTLLNESELARRFKVSTSAIREFLIRFSRYGLIEKQENRGWVLNGFTKEFALELCEIREMFERKSIEKFMKQPDEAECWKSLALIEAQHQDLLDRIDKDYLEFSKLDDVYHKLINSIASNRFISDFHNLIAVIFHYHYRWNKQDERQRNEIAIKQHLDIIAALKNKDVDAVEKASRKHLQSAKQTLLNSINWETS